MTDTELLFHNPGTWLAARLTHSREVALSNYLSAPYSARTSGCHAKVVLSKLQLHGRPLAKTLSCTTLYTWYNGQVNPAHPPARPGMPSSGLPSTSRTRACRPLPSDSTSERLRPMGGTKGAQQPTRPRSSMRRRWSCFQGSDWWHYVLTLSMSGGVVHLIQFLSTTIPTT